ncbi:hypothetical protein FNV43_RR00061 [Rhamnella rubrinervis]|uniref:Integrator complex subunit 3 N-terminal domain-containing protein n=1 Tax=Rhamnella rubrinervis TaxID=2594499 RepID=A0A8K0MRJ3_9ROSA|nr:hypothetical protein FNV43_RR00061 [Rhamnella rubrinervis]
MASKLIRTIPYEAENQTELSLRQAFEVLELRLRPTFPLTIPNLQEYLQLNQAILYGVLGGPNSAKIHIKHLHAIVTDGYCSFVSFIKKVVNELYVKLIDSAKGQLIWVIQIRRDLIRLLQDLVHVHALKSWKDLVFNLSWLLRSCTKNLIEAKEEGLEENIVGSLRTLILKIVHSNVETLQNLISDVS